MWTLIGWTVAVLSFGGIVAAVWHLAYSFGFSHAKPTVKEKGNMVLKRIPIDDHPDLVKMIEDAFNGGRISEAYIHKITLDGDDVTIEIDLNIDGVGGITSTFQMELDDFDNPLAEKLREILALEDGND